MRCGCWDGGDEDRIAFARARQCVQCATAGGVAMGSEIRHPVGAHPAPQPRCQSARTGVAVKQCRQRWRSKTTRTAHTRLRRCLTDRRPDALPSRGGSKPSSRRSARARRDPLGDSWLGAPPAGSNAFRLAAIELDEQRQSPPRESGPRPRQAHDLACRRRPLWPRCRLPPRVGLRACRASTAVAVRRRGGLTPSFRSRAPIRLTASLLVVIALEYAVGRGDGGLAWNRPPL